MARKSSPPIRRSRPLIGQMFEWYARGDISLKEAARKAHAAGLVYPRSGAKVPVSTIHTILRNRLYTGWFEWNGKLIQGRHEALVPVELSERVQGVLDGRFTKKAKRSRHDSAFSGLIECAQCGCAVVGEIKKQRYVYYHCTGYADKCQGNPAFCRRKYVREEALEAQFTELLGQLKFDDEVLEWVREALHASHADQSKEHLEAIERCEPSISASAIASTRCMWISSTAGWTPPSSDRMSAGWREEQNRCLREIEHHGAAEQSYMEEGVHILELARNTGSLFERQQPREKRRLLSFMPSNCTWEDGKVIATLRQPFDLLAKPNAISAYEEAGKTADVVKREIWLGD
jgi:site-specific DNA recombinase